MQKGIPRQPKVRTNTLELIGNGSRLHPGFNVCADVLLADLKSMLIRNCGTRYHAGLTMRYWLESMAGIRCTMKLASHTCGDTLYAFAEADSDFPESELIQVLRLLEHYGDLSPKLHMVPQHLLAYHGAEDGSRCG
jgi:glucosamine 6-phosphate synthetase-like amidotransferase/phosphosugar isomerase protein